MYLPTEYGPPSVNLTCYPDEEYASMTSLPTGSLSVTEMQNEFVLGCKVNWTCTDGTSSTKKPYSTEVM